MNIRFLLGLGILVYLIPFSCERKNNNPHDVRHLMEINGWEYCCRIFTDTYYKGGREEEPWMKEENGTYSLYKKDADFALVLPQNENRSLSNFNQGHEMLSANYWIAHHVVYGNYSVSAQVKDHLGRTKVNKRYNGKASTNAGAIYCNIPESFCYPFNITETYTTTSIEVQFN